jgi:hypothetical protein
MYYSRAMLKPYLCYSSAQVIGMSKMGGVGWEMFQLDEIETVGPSVPRDCCVSCLEAHEIVCRCTCGGKNHGAWMKKDVKPLDEFEELN